MVGFYDSHIHTCHSPDSQQAVQPIWEFAVSKGLKGISITDHSDLLWSGSEDIVAESIRASIADTKEAAARYEGKLKIFCGVEIADHQDNPKHTEKILGLTDYDIVLGSIHTISFADWDDAYSRICFDAAEASEDKLTGFMGAYFKKLLRMAEKEDFDVLTHLTCPLRYINGKYHRNFSVQPFSDLIDEILGAVIKRRKALEVNTSGLHSFYGEWMPSRDILERYYAMGGRMITLASDAHTADRLANGFSETVLMLKEIGFLGYYYYEQRKPCWVSWERTAE